MNKLHRNEPVAYNDGEFEQPTIGDLLKTEDDTKKGYSFGTKKKSKKKAAKKKSGSKGW